MRMVLHNSLGTLAAFIVCLAVTGCGGGGSYGGGRNPPPLTQPGSLQFESGNVSIDEHAGTVQLTITRTAGSDGAVSAGVASGDATAIAGQDYTALNTTVNFAAGDAVAKTVTVSITDDGQAEADEGFVVVLLEPTGGAQRGPTRVAAITIRDNDPPSDSAPAAPAVQVSAATKQLTFTWASVSRATSYRLLRDPDGASGFTQVGADYPGDAVSASLEVSVHRHNWVNAQYRVEACNAHGCSGSNAVSALTAMVQAIGYFKASNTGANDQFGVSLALSADGTTLAIGARDEDSAATGVGGNEINEDAVASGAVYVFALTGAQWSQQAYVKASNTQAEDLFGISLALSADGSTLAVGAVGEDSNATGGQDNNDAGNAGAVYVFTRDAAQWSQQSYLKASNTGANDNFGGSLALSADGNTLAVGASREDSTATGVDGDQGSDGALNAGAVYVFTRAGTQWSKQAYVKASNTGADDNFGTSLALSADGSTLAVGALGEDSDATGGQDNNGAVDAGAVYVFTRDVTQWSQQAYLKASNTQMTDFFGTALALSADGTTLAVVASGEDSNAVGVGGDESNNDAESAGAVYVFTREATQWLKQAYVKASNTDANDRFGTALALSADGSTLAVGAQLEASNAVGVDGDGSNDDAALAGAMYVFRRAGTLWSQQTYVKASNTGAGDQFGVTLGLSADGSTLAVGALREGSNATGVAGDQGNDAAPNSGAVYVF